MIRNADIQDQNYSEHDCYSSPVAEMFEYPSLSFVIPVFNEEESLEELTQRIAENVPSGLTFEIIFIDDGSTDDSWSVIQSLADIYKEQIRSFRFRSNRGKAAGLQTGFKAARGEVIFTMDADLQDDPQEIPRFLNKLNEGFDLVSGWKKVRHDPWHKVLPSRIFNRMLSYFSNVSLHDHNCGFKCYRREVAKQIQLFGELHRMVPSLAGMQGFQVTEIPVQHHARKHGYSKYGVERFIRGFSDMLTIGFLRKYRERPAHFANTWAAFQLAIAMLLVLAGTIFGPTTTSGLITLLAATGFVGFASSCFLVGLIAELIIRQNRNLNVVDHISDERSVSTTSRRLSRYGAATV